MKKALFTLSAASLMAFATMTPAAADGGPVGGASCFLSSIGAIFGAKQNCGKAESAKPAKAGKKSAKASKSKKSKKG